MRAVGQEEMCGSDSSSSRVSYGFLTTWSCQSCADLFATLHFSLICHQFCAHSVRTFSITEGARNDDGVWCERVSIHCWVAQDGFIYDSLSKITAKCPKTTQPSILDLFVSAAILQCFDHFHKVPLDLSLTMNMPSLKQV